MYLKNYHFKFKAVPTLAFIIAFSCFIRLGFWQLERADKKNILNDSYASRQQDDLIILNKADDLNHKEALLWRKVRLNGSFLNEQNIILDNQIFNQTAGFNIITPFKISNSKYVVLINRGWHPNLENRKLIPNISPIDGSLNIAGHIAKFPVSGINLGQENIETLNASVFRLQRLDYDELNYFLTFNLLPYMIYLDPIKDKEYLSNFKLPAPDSEKNYGYAFQWFAFAFTLLIIFLRLGIERKKVVK